MIKKFRSFIYPSVCLHCNDRGHNGLDLCRRCYENLPWISYACERCALPLPVNSSAVCGACSNRKLFFDQALTPFLFEQFVREAVYEFKFNSKLNYGKLLTQLLAEYVQQRHLPLPDIIIPVPLHRKRLRKRGFNQALEIARMVNQHIPSCIRVQDVQRMRETRVQMELPAKTRYANVKDAFVVRSAKSPFIKKHVAIIDDVMTTGNTVNEVAKCIRKAGAERIDVWCIARVP